MPNRELKINGLKISNSGQLFFIAGNCVIENEKTARLTARKLKSIFSSLKVPFVYKVSFDKANRTSIDSYRGPGLERGLTILKDIKQEFGLTVLTDIHLPQQARLAAETADIIQIPAFLCRQTDMLLAAGDTGRAVNVKKGQFLSPSDMENAVRKIESTGNRRILLTERGSSFGYGNLIVDLRSLEIMKSFGYPVIFDCTHSVQKPGALGKSTGGDRRYAWSLAKGAAAVGIAGIFMETHPSPEKALSDGPNSLPLNRVHSFVSSLKALDKFVKSMKEVKL